MSRKRSTAWRLLIGGLACSATALWISGGSRPVWAGTPPPQAVEIRFTVGETRYAVDGRERLMDAAPFVREGRTYVPVRYLAEPMGARVEWDGPRRRVTLTFPGRILELFIGRPVVAVNGEETPIPVAPVTKGGRAYLPARFVAEAAGYEVGWDARRRQVVISLAHGLKVGWADPYAIWVFGRPPVAYLREVGAAGTLWSVFFWGRNPEEEAYVRRLREAGYWVLSNLASEQGSQWRGERGWHGLDPALVEAGACRRNDGSIVYFDLGTDTMRVAYMDHNTPAWRGRLETMVEEHVAGGADGMLIDGLQGPAVSVFYGGCFSPETVAGFRRYLARRFPPDALRAEFGIGDVQNFDYGRYLAAKGVGNAYEDDNRPLLREYLRFLYSSRLAFLAALIREAKERGGPGFAIAGNAYQFEPKYQPLLPLLDVAVSELPMGTLPEGKQAGLYLLAKAIAGPKPVVGFPDIFVLARLSPRDHGLWRHWLAEALASGATLLLPYEAFTQGGGSFTLPAGEIAPYTRFLRAHPEIYTPETRSPARVAVLYDLASTLFDWNAWQGYLDLAAALQEQHIPYDVLFLGDGEMAAGTVSRENLRRYEAILLPPLHRALAAGESLSAHTAAGGKVLRLEPGSVTRVGSLLRQLGVDPGLQTDAPPSLAVFPRLTPWGGAVHLVNYDYDYARHGFRRQTDITLKLALPAGVAAADVAGMTLKLLTPDGKDGPTERMLPWRLEGDAITFTVPEVDAYAVAVFDTRRDPAR